jgi:hypothetical protein
MVERTGSRQPGGRDVADRDPGRAERGAGTRGERRDDRVGTGLWGRARVASDEGRAVTLEAGNGGPDVGPAEIEAEVEGAQTFGSRAATSGAFRAEASLPKTLCWATL